MAFLKKLGRAWPRRAGAWCLVLLPLLGWSVPSATRLRGTEAELRATYVYKFALFTRWPAAAFESANSPMVVAVIGNDPIVPELEKLAAAMTVNERRFKLVLAESGADAPECHILYVAGSEKGRVPELLEQVKGKPVLTVSDLEPWCRLGGCIRFARAERRVSLLFNPKAAAAQGLRISPELLAIGKIRETEKNVEPK